jgi:hypothetical protein
MFDWIKKALRPKQPAVDPYDQFVIELIEEFKRQGRVPKSYDHHTRSFFFSDGDAGEIEVHLDNVFGNWLARDPNGRAEVLSRFVRGIDASSKNRAISPEKLPDELMPGIRSRVQISHTLLRSWIAGAPIDDSAETAWLPFAGDLAACVLCDQSDTMSQMTHANLRFAQLPIAQAMPRAMTNFRARSPSPIFESVGEGVFGCANLEDHQSALLLLQPGQDYAPPAIEGAPVALVPGRNVFYLTGSANGPGLTRLLEIARNAHQTPNFCSSMMLQWSGDRWSEFQFDPGSTNAGGQRDIALAQSATDYGFQKQLLDRYYQKHGMDIFVASLMLFRKKDADGSLFSVTSLGSGTVGTLLPRADRLSFVKQVFDPATGLAQKGASDIADVAWSEAMEIVGDLFEPVSFLYPPRLRALGFPEADVWARLKALNPSPRP